MLKPAFINRAIISSTLVLLALTVCLNPASAQSPARSSEQDTSEVASVQRAPVVLSGDTLCWITEKMGSFTPQERADAVSRRLQGFVRRSLAPGEAISVIGDSSGAEIQLGDVIIMSVTPTDAAAEMMNSKEYAEKYAAIFSAAITQHAHDYTLKSLLLGVVFTILVTMALLLVLKFQARFFLWLNANVVKIRFPSLRFQRLELLSRDKITKIVQQTTKGLHLIILLMLWYFYLSIVLSFFPWTRGFAGKLLEYVLSPVSALGQAVLNYLPNVFFIAVIVLVTRMVLKLVRRFFEEIKAGNININGFHVDWADPTYKIVRFIIFAFALIVIFPYLPGSKSPAFQGVSVFLGVLFSLGSTSAIANIVAGTVITYMRPFKIGDRVKIADTMGDVVEKTLLVTRIKTIKNVLITIPNAMVMGSHIINYSSVEHGGKLILNTGVTIGYDVPWRQVHELLLSAARGTEGVLADPPPFILQTSLDDFYVSYELNAYTDQPNKMAVIYSALHQNIQDRFNEAGVEIMSPHYGALRDGNTVTIPPENLPLDYKAPSFRIEKINNEK